MGTNFSIAKNQEWFVRIHDALFMFSKIECMIHKRWNVRILVKKSNSIEKARRDKKKVRVIVRNSYKGPTNLFDLPRCSSFRVFELKRFFCLKGVSNCKYIARSPSIFCLKEYMAQ